MTLPVVIGIGLAGGLGAMARFAFDGAITSRVAADFPFGTLAVNLSGAFALGVLAGAALHADAYDVAGTGFVGAYTTFSTWAFESQRLGEDGELRVGLLNFGVSLALGVAAAWLGRRLGVAL